MREQMESRLQSLTAEFNAGQKMLADLDAKQAHLRSALLRINGAMQVLEELLTGEEAQRQQADSVDKIKTPRVSAA